MTVYVNSSGNPITFPENVRRPGDTIYKMLSETAVSPPGVDMLVVMASPAVERQFEFIVPATSPGGMTVSWAVIKRLNFTILDSVVDPAKFGNLAALTNGCTCKIINGNVSPEVELLDLLDGTTIKTSSQFARLVGSDAQLNKGTSGSEATYPRFSFFKNVAQILAPGEILRFGINDTLTGLVAPFDCMVQGYYV